MAAGKGGDREVDIVLGVSMASTSVRMVLVEGENADGAAVEEDTFEVSPADGSATSSAPEQVIAAILGTWQGAAEGGYRLMSTGVTWTEPSEVAALREALAVRDIGNVMLVSPLLAAAALAQTVGHAIGYESTALLFVEPQSAILAVVETAAGSIVDLQRRHLQCAPSGAAAVTELAAMVTSLERLESPPGGVFVVGCGVDIAPIKSQLDAAVALPVSAPEEPDMALARGAALASADAPLFASSTAAVAYAQDPGTGEVNPDALAPRYLNVGANVASGALAYSAVADENDPPPRPRRGLLVASAVAAIFAIGFAALVISLAADIRPTVGQPSTPPAALVPAKHAPAPPAAPPPAPPPSAAPAPPAPPSSPPPQTITVPTPVVQQSPQRVVTPAPVQKEPARQVPAYVPPAPKEAPPPAAPAPPPEAPPPPPAAPAPPPAPHLPPMVMYLHLPFVTVPIPINPPPPPPPPPGP